MNCHCRSAEVKAMTAPEGNPNTGGSKTLLVVWGCHRHDDGH